MTRNDDDDGPQVFGVLAEFHNQGPILMECEGPRSSRESALDHLSKLRGRPDVVRVALVKLTYESGNELLLLDMQRMQE